MHSHPDLTGELPPGVAALGRSGVRDRHGPSEADTMSTCGADLRPAAAGRDRQDEQILALLDCPLGDCRFARKPTMGPSPPIAEPPDLAVFGRFVDGWTRTLLCRVGRDGHDALSTGPPTAHEHTHCLARRRL